MRLATPFSKLLVANRGEIALRVMRTARGLGLRTVAEGVETEAQRRRLIDLGCDLGQGYLFARPLAATALLDRLAERATPWVTAA